MPLESSSGADTIQKEQVDRIGQIDVLTDVPAVQKFCDRLSKETGATVRATSLRKIVVESATGKYLRQLGMVRFDGEGEATPSHKDYAPTAAEAEAIKAAWKLVAWPEYRPCLFTGRHEPRDEPSFPWSKADPVNVFVCWDMPTRRW